MNALEFGPKACANPDPFNLWFFQRNRTEISKLARFSPGSFYSGGIELSWVLLLANVGGRGFRFSFLRLGWGAGGTPAVGLHLVTTGALDRPIPFKRGGQGRRGQAKKREKKHTRQTNAVMGQLEVKPGIEREISFQTRCATNLPDFSWQKLLWGRVGLGLNSNRLLDLARMRDLEKRCT